jgi:uncharacterized caspase-like protein
LLIFAGHGIEMGGVNYLIPIDARLARDTHLPDEAIALERILDKVSGARQLRLVILDACRNNPFTASMIKTGGAARSIGRGLARTEPDGDVLVLYASKHGTIAEDGEGANSPFAMALMEHLTSPGVEVRLMFGRESSVRCGTLADAEKTVELTAGDKTWPYLANWRMVLNTRGHIYVALGHLDKALADFDIAVEHDPEHVSAYMGRGLAYERKGDRDRAIGDFKKAVALPASSRDAKAAQAKAQQQLAVLSAGPTRRIALVIGNSTYSSVARLNNPANDAKAIASALRRIGFADVTERFDLAYRQLRDELKAFGDKASAADWAVVYFAGHGMQVNQVTYLIPTDANLVRAGHIEDEAIPLPYVLSKVEEARQLRLVILDACRDNPFLPRMVQSAGVRSAGRGLGRIEPERGILVAYAARDGQLAQDGGERHSRRTVGRVGRQPFGLQTEAFLSPLDHRLGRAHLGLSDGARGLDIHDDAELHVDEIIVGVGKEKWPRLFGQFFRFDKWSLCRG